MTVTRANLFDELIGGLTSPRPRTCGPDVGSLVGMYPGATSHPFLQPRSRILSSATPNVGPAARSPSMLPVEHA
jgi:hypothetical protein